VTKSDNQVQREQGKCGRPRNMALNCGWSYAQLEALCLRLGVSCVWVLAEDLGTGSNELIAQ
jgi:hypothetical protein